MGLRSAKAREERVLPGVSRSALQPSAEENEVDDGAERDANVACLLVGTTNDTVRCL